LAKPIISLKFFLKSIIVFKDTDIKYQMSVGMWSHWNTCKLLVECELAQAFWKNIWHYLVRLMICISYDLALLQAYIQDRLLHMCLYPHCKIKKTESIPIVHQQCNKKQISSNEKEWIIAMHNDMDGFRNHMLWGKFKLQNNTTLKSTTICHTKIGLNMPKIWIM
jgi:hypothetical protein